MFATETSIKNNYCSQHPKEPLTNYCSNSKPHLTQKTAKLDSVLPASARTPRATSELAPNPSIPTSKTSKPKSLIN